MATKLADAYVQIIPSAKGMKNSLTKLMSGEASSAGTSAGGLFTTAFVSGIGTIVSGVTKVTATAVAAATAGIAALTTSAVKSYAEYEQLVGGVETLFTPTQSMSEFVTQLQEIGVSAQEASSQYSEGADKVMEQASNAWKTAGLSTNDYLETVTSFSASLISSLGGDTVKAASYADMAITDMSDNANKMGTDISSIQNAYQGFAKQNYTMLDNLKLGYGGTKTEMQRLIEDADALSDSFTAQRDEAGSLTMSYADIVDAIHIVQENMGIAGTTTLEATTTISGSLNMLKASWSNLVTGLADEDADLNQLMQNVIDSLVGTTDEAGNKIEKGFLDNIIPVIETSLTSIGSLFTTLVPTALSLLPTLMSSVLPDIISAGTSLVDGLVNSISDNMDDVEAIANQLIGSFSKIIPDMVELGGQLLSTLGSAILDNLDTILGVAGNVLTTICKGLQDNADKLVAGAIQIVESLGGFIRDNADMLIDTAVSVVLAIVTGISENLSDLIILGLEIVTAISESILENTDVIINAISDLVSGFCDGLIEHSDEIADAFVDLMDVFAKVIPIILDSLAVVLPELVGKIYDYFSGDGYIKVQAASTKMFEGIIYALASILSSLWSAIGDLIVNLAMKITNGQTNLQVAAISMFDGITNGLVTKAADILTLIGTKISEWVQAVKNKVSDWVTAGGSLIDGLKQGFQNKLSSVTTAISNGAKSIADAAKSALGINSPSKVFAEIGAGCVEGLEVGWDKNIKSVQNDINKDMEFKGSINTEFANNNAKTTSSADNNGTRIVINETINLPSGDTKEVFYEYVVQTEGDKTRAVKIAQGGY